MKNDRLFTKKNHTNKSKHRASVIFVTLCLTKFDKVFLHTFDAMLWK